MDEKNPEVSISEREVPGAIKRARAAFLRDFPRLIADRKNRGRYVCYCDDQQVFLAKSYLAAEAEAIARKLPHNAFLILKVASGNDKEQQVIADEAEFDLF